MHTCVVPIPCRPAKRLSGGASSLYFLIALFLYAAAGIASASTTYIQNGGFETGDFTDWTLTNGQYTSVGGNPHSGTYAYFNGEYAPGSTLSQTVDTTIGDVYALSFWVAESAYGYSPGYSFTAASSASGTPLLVLYNTPDFDYTQFTEYFQATAVTTTISFSGYNLPGGTSLDDVDLIDTAPEPSSWSLFALGGAALILARTKLRFLYS